jgi:heme exporter protein C
VYWTWDARLTTFSLLFLLYLGYLVVRRLPADVEVRNRRSAFVALLAFVDVPIVYLSVSWWRGLHQEATLSLSSTISGLMLFTLVLGIIVSLMGFLWLLTHRFRVAWLEDEVEMAGLDLAIDERRAEAAVMEVSRP